MPFNTLPGYVSFRLEPKPKNSSTRELTVSVAKKIIDTINESRYIMKSKEVMGVYAR